MDQHDLIIGLLWLCGWSQVFWLLAIGCLLMYFGTRS